MEETPGDELLRRQDIRLMATAEVIAAFGVSNARAYEIMKSNPGFPTPIAELKVGRVWLADDVEKWIAENRPAKEATR